jgi:phage I-like protein
MLLLIAAAGEVIDGLRRIPVAMVARGFKGKQKFVVTAADLAAVVKNFRKRSADLVIDYDHSTDFSAGSGEPAPAAGWLKTMDDGPDAQGVLWGSAEFTERAAKMVAAREYKYVSPVMVWGVRDKATGEPQGTTITSIALTNSPLLEKLPAIAFSDEWQIGKEKLVTKLIMADRLARTVRVIADDGTESVLPLEGLEVAPKVVRMSDVKRGKEGLWDFTSLDVSEGTLIGSDVVRGMMVQTQLDVAVKAGKITPAQRPFYERMAMSDLDSFRQLAETMTPVVDLKEHGMGGGGEDTLAASDLAKVEGLIHSKTLERMKGTTLQYHEAMKLVASENPDLDRRRTQLQRAKAQGGDE